MHVRSDAVDGFGTADLADTGCGGGGLPVGVVGGGRVAALSLQSSGKADCTRAESLREVQQRSRLVAERSFFSGGAGEVGDDVEALDGGALEPGESLELRADPGGVLHGTRQLRSFAIAGAADS